MDARLQNVTNKRSTRCATRKPGWKSKLTLLCASLSCCFALAELVLRVLGVQPQTATVLSSFFEYDRHTGWRGKPLARLRFTTVNFDTLVSHDAQGFRSSLPGRIDDDAQQRTIWVLGDSGTWGWGVNDGETFIDLLNGDGHDDRCFRNLGHSGYSTVQEYLLLRQLLSQGNRPSEVLVLFCHNDIVENDEKSDDDPPRPHASVKHGQIEITNQPVPRTGKWNLIALLKNHSLAYNHLHFHALRARMAITEQTRAKKRSVAAAAVPAIKVEAIVSDTSYYTAERMNVLRHFYGLMRDLCHERGVRFGIISEFRMDPAIRAVCDDLGVPLLDTTQRFARFEASVEAKQPWRFATDPHCTPLGHRLLAEGIREELIRLDGKLESAAPELPRPEMARSAGAILH